MVAMRYANQLVAISMRTSKIFYLIVCMTVTPEERGEITKLSTLWLVVPLQA